MYLNFLIIGLGKLGKIHLSKISYLMDGLQYKTVDPNIAEADYSEVPSGWNLEYDVVVVSTPTNNHLQTVRELKEKYLNNRKVPLILIEKPVGQTVKERNDILKILGMIAETVQTNSTEVFSKVTKEIGQLLQSDRQVKKITFKRSSLGQAFTEPFTDLIWHDFSILVETKIINLDNIESIDKICFAKKTKNAVQCSYNINKPQKISIEHEALYVKFVGEIDRKCFVLCEDDNLYEFNFMDGKICLNSKKILEVDETDKIMDLWGALSNCKNSGIDHSHLYQVSKILETVETYGK